MKQFKENLLLQFSITSFLIILTLAVTLSIVFSIRLNRNIQNLEAHGLAMDRMIHEASIEHHAIDHASVDNEEMDHTVGQEHLGEMTTGDTDLLDNSTQSLIIQDSDPYSIPMMKQDIEALRALTIAMIGGSFIILYVSLAAIVGRGWRTIRQQNEQLEVEIAERKQAEYELRVARDQALEMSQAKSSLLARVSHELRTPLGAILGNSQLLEQKLLGSLSKPQEEAVLDLIDSSRYLSELVNDLLDQSQLDASQLALKSEPFSPRDTLHQVESKMEILAREKRLNLNFEIAEDLPKTLMGDAIRIQQIIMNLIGNAIKFTEEGEVTLQSYTIDRTHWAIKVSDTGPGISTEHQAHIFEPFGQVDNTMTRTQAGTGLGLSIVNQLVTLMNGQITLESEVGQGSIFTVKLPLIQTQENMT